MNLITQYGLGVLVLVLVLGSVYKLDLPYSYVPFARNSVWLGS